MELRNLHLKSSFYELFPKSVSLKLYVNLRWDVKFCIFKVLPKDADTAGQQITP